MNHLETLNTVKIIPPGYILFPPVKGHQDESLQKKAAGSGQTIVSTNLLKNSSVVFLAVKLGSMLSMGVIPVPAARRSSPGLPANWEGSKSPAGNSWVVEE